MDKEINEETLKLDFSMQSTRVAPAAEWEMKFAHFCALQLATRIRSAASITVNATQSREMDLPVEGQIPKAYQHQSFISIQTAPWR